MLSFVAQKEHENIRQRQAEGIAIAKAEGVRFGRPEKDMPDNFGELVRQWERGKIRTDEMLKLCKVGRTTLYAKLKEYKLQSRKRK